MASEVAAGRGLHDGYKTHDPIECRIQKDPRKQRADGTWRLAVRVRQPIVHWRQTRLGAIAYEYEDEGKFHGFGVHPMRNPSERGKVERTLRPQYHCRSVVGYKDPEQGEGDSYGAENNVFPRCLDSQRSFVETEPDKKSRHNCCGFYADPHDGEVVRHGHQEHGKDKKM